MRRSHVPARRRVPGTRALLVAVAAAGLTLAPLPAGAAPAEPTPATSQEAGELLAARAHDLEVVTEEFNEARELLLAAQRDAVQAAEAVAAAEAALADARGRVREVARSVWTGDRLGSAAAMLTSDSPDELLDRVATLQTIAEHNNGLLGDAVATDDARSRHGTGPTRPPRRRRRCSTRSPPSRPTWPSRSPPSRPTTTG